MLIGDASGHGLKACMSIMAMHTLIRMLGGDRYRDTAAFVTDINERLCENSIVQGGGGFITLFYAALDVETHVLQWTTAGHPLPLLHAADGEVRPIGDGSEGGLPLGVTSGVPYDSARLTLPAGGRVLLYTRRLGRRLPAEREGRPRGLRRRRHRRGVAGQPRPPDGRDARPPLRGVQRLHVRRRPRR